MNTIEICNLALMKLGIPAILSFDDENENAKLCKTFFPALRDRVLRDYNWSFARAAVQLTRLDEKSFDREYPFVFAMPGDCIRIVGEVNNIPFIRFGNRVHARAESVTMIYTRRVADSEQFDPAFGDALSLLIAAQIGLSNTRDLQKVNYYTQEYERVLANARSIDSAENVRAYQTGRKRSEWLAGRGGF